MKKITCIYKIISPSGKMYIGQTANLHDRIKKYRLELCKEQPKLYYSLKKYGWINHTVEIIQECDKSELNYLEKTYIEKYNTFNSKSGLNLRGGGDHGGVLSKESISKIRNKLLGTQDGEKNNFFGRKHTEESLLKMRTNRSEETKVKFKNGWIKRREKWAMYGNPRAKKPKIKADVNMTALKIRQSCIKNKEGKSSIYLGVSGILDGSIIIDGKRVYRKWKVQIKHQGVTYRGGRFSNEREAAIAYNKAAIEYHGEFANLNVID